MANRYVYQRNFNDYIKGEHVPQKFEYDVFGVKLRAIRIDGRTVKNLYCLEDLAKILGYAKGQYLSHYTNSLDRREEWTKLLNGRTRYRVHSIVVKNLSETTWYVSKELADFVMSIRKKPPVAVGLTNKLYETFRLNESQFHNKPKNEVTVPPVTEEEDWDDLFDGETLFSESVPKEVSPESEAVPPPNQNPSPSPKTGGSDRYIKLEEDNYSILKKLSKFCHNESLDSYVNRLLRDDLAELTNSLNNA
jgi:hypothetical protein